MIITDWDDAYANSRYVPDFAAWPGRWAARAAALREALAGESRIDIDVAYGPTRRHVLDVLRPRSAPQGLAIFVHGGYWRSLDKSYWSHLAQGFLARGLEVAVLSYRLVPKARIAEIGRDVASAIAFAAARTDGPIYLAGHSAGAHLVTRCLCADGALPVEVRSRVRRSAAISGIYDLRPLLRTEMNATSFRLDDEEARAESPALLEPAAGASVICWVGANELPEFRRQNALLASAWLGLGAETFVVEEADRHHNDVVAALEDPDHPLLRLMFDPPEA